MSGDHLPAPGFPGAEYFCRFRLTESRSREARKRIDEGLAFLAGPGAHRDPAAELEARLSLGFFLIPLDEEAEAAIHLAIALRLARGLGDAGAEIEALLHLATAQQYLGERDVAQELFRQGLDLSERSGIGDHVHFLHHHAGRCYAEQGQPDQARESFERALALRRQIGDARYVASTEQALAALASLSQPRGA